jgi:hypothetical protein
MCFPDFIIYHIVFHNDNTVIFAYANHLHFHIKKQGIGTRLITVYTRVTPKAGSVVKPLFYKQ